MRILRTFLLGIIFTMSAYAQNCIDVGVVLDRELNSLMFSNVLLAGERFLAFDGGNETGYKVSNFENFRVCNGFYRYFNAPFDSYNQSTTQGTYWAYFNDKWNGHIDNFDLLIKNKKVDAKGFPLSLPITMPNADSTWNVTIYSLFRKVNLPPNYTQGEYGKAWVLRWKGKGELEFGNNITNIYKRTSNVDGNLFFVSSGGQVRMEIQLNGLSPIELKITKSDPSDPIRDLELLYPGTEALVDAGNNINPVFIEKMKNFKMLRFRECLGATTYRELGGSETDPLYSEWIRQINWEERVKKDWYWQNGRRGMALEYVIEICNQAKINPWVSLPFCASEQFCNEAGKLFMNTLSPDLIAYFELGYNMMFWDGNGEYGRNNGFYYFQQVSQTTYSGLGSIEATGAYLNDMFAAIGEGAGSMNLGRRIKRIASTWGTYYSVNNRQLSQIDPKNWECMPDTWSLSWEDAEETCNGAPNFRQQLIDYYNAHPNDQQGFNQLYLEVLRNNFKYCTDKWTSNGELAEMYGKSLILGSGSLNILRRPSVGGCYPCANGPNKTQLPGGECDCNNEYLGKSCFDWNMNVATYPSHNPLLNAFFAADTSWAVEQFLSEVFDTMQSRGVVAACYGSFAGQDPSCSGDGSLIYKRDLYKPYDTLFYRHGRFRAVAKRKMTANCDLSFQVDANKKGPGIAAMFDGYDDHISTTLPYIPNETADYTVEGWFNIKYVGSEQVLFSMTHKTSPDVNYNTVKIKKDGTFNWSIGHYIFEDLNLNGTKAQAGKWHHVAITRSGQRYTMYINGKNVASINKAIGTINRTALTLGATINYYGTSGYFLGDVDEVRLWNIARSEADVRSFMCKKTTKTNLGTRWANLKLFYNFDEVDMEFNSIYNVSTNAWEGEYFNPGYNRLSGYSPSGAPLGDYSVNRYTTNWTNVALTLNHPQGDGIAVLNMGSGIPDGAHIYYIDSTAFFNSMPKYYVANSTGRYWGVFMANGTEPTYDVAYLYNGHPQAKTGTEATNNRLLHRDHSADTSWKHSGAKLDMIAQSLFLGCKEIHRGEYTLALRKDLSQKRPGSGKALKYSCPIETTNVGSEFFAPLSSYTVTFWGKGTAQHVLTFAPASGGGTNANLSFNKGEFSVRWNLSNEALGLSSNTMSGNNDWVHYALVKTGANIKLYVNGVLDADKDMLGDFLARRIGFMNFSGYTAQNTFSIDELTLFNIPLDQQTIRDYMCKKIDGNHPYACKNMILYFNFDEGQGNVLEDKYGPNDIDLQQMTYTSWTTSGAAIGDASSNSYEQPFANTLTHPNGDYITVTTSDLPKGVHLYRINDYPPIQSLVNDPAIKSIDSIRYWGLYTVKNSAAIVNYTLSDFYEKNGQVKLPQESELRLLSRANNADTLFWNANILTLPDIDNNKITLANQTRGEYVLGGTETNTFRGAVPPALPVFSTETLDLNRKSICGNAVNLEYAVDYDPNVSTYKWTLPVGLDGYSTTNSIIINAAYSGTTPIIYTIMVKAINAYGVSADVSYTLTVNPAPTIADAGPDVMIFPPANTAKMDGNTIGTNETAYWVLADGQATITDPNAPKTTVTAIGNGINKFYYNISNATCPPSIDSMLIILGPPPTGIVMSDDSPLPTKVCGGATWNIKAIPPVGITPSGYKWILPSGIKMISNAGAYATIYLDNGLGGKIGVQSLYSGTPSDTFLSEPVAIFQTPNKPVLTIKPDTLCWQEVPNPFYECQIDATIDSFAWELPYGIYPSEFPKSTDYYIQVNALVGTAKGWIKVKAFNNGCTSSTASDSVYVVVDTNTPPAPSLKNHPYGWTGNNGSNGHMCPTLTVAWIMPDDSISTYDFKLMNPSNNIKVVKYLNDVPTAVLWDYRELQQKYDVNLAVTRIIGNGSCNESKPVIGGSNATRSASETFLADPIALIYPAVYNLLDVQIGDTLKFRTAGGYQYINVGHGRVFYWDVPTGLEVISDGQLWDSLVTVKVKHDFADYLEVYGLTHWGCTQGSAKIKVGTSNFPFPPEYVSGALTYCVGDFANIEVEDVNAHKYIWYFPNGTIDSTDSFVYDKAFNSNMAGQLKVVARRGAFYSTPVFMNLAVRPSSYSNLTFYNKYGEEINLFTMCSNESQEPLYMRNVGADSVKWRKTGGQINLSSASIYDTVSYWSPANAHFDPQNPGFIEVKVYNSCLTTSPFIDSIPYLKSTAASSQIPAFDNPVTSACVGSQVTYRVTGLKDIESYIWKLPSGLIAQSIVTTVPEITVLVSNGQGGIIEVYGTSTLCGGGKTDIGKSPVITIIDNPIDFNFVQQPLAACGLGDTMIFSVTPVAGVSKYYWSAPPSLGETILDSHDTSTAKIKKTGTWLEVLHDEAYNGKFYRISNTTKGNTFQFVADLPYSGKYRVDLFWIEYKAGSWNNSTTVPVEVIHKYGSTNMSVDMLNPATGFHEIGSFYFDKGMNDTVIISTNGDENKWSVADAVRFTLDSLVSDTVASFRVISTSNDGAVCATAMIPQCTSGYTICTDPINTTGVLKAPVIQNAPSDVCAGESYTYVSSDIGAGIYNWILPKGMSINGDTGTVAATRSVVVRIDTTLVAPVQLGVYGTIMNCSVSSDTAWSSNVTMSTTLCPLADPVFTRVPDSVCVGSAAVFEIQNIPGANHYEWQLPDGISALETGATGIVNTDESRINVLIDKEGTLASIVVRAVSLTAPSSMSVPSGSIISIEARPSVIVSPETTCPGDSGIIMINQNPLLSYEYIIEGATWYDTAATNNIKLVWGEGPAGKIDIIASSSFGCSERKVFNVDLNDDDTKILCPANIEKTVKLEKATGSYDFIPDDTLKPIITSRCGWSSLINDYDSTRNEIFDSIPFLIPTDASKVSKSIKWVVSDKKGRKDSCLLTIDLLFSIDLIPYTAFSPNGDGKNDYWVIENIDLESYNGATIQIFNRWGQLVWEHKVIAAQGGEKLKLWDGRDQKGIPVPFDSYHYMIIQNGKTIKMGSLLIVR